MRSLRTLPTIFNCFKYSTYVVVKPDGVSWSAYIYEAKQKKKSIRNKRIKRIKIVRNIEDIRLKRLIEKQNELHQYRVKGVKIGAVLPLQHERI